MNPCIYCARLAMSGKVCELNHPDKQECAYWVKTRKEAKANPLPERR